MYLQTAAPHRIREDARTYATYTPGFSFARSLACLHCGPGGRGNTVPSTRENIPINTLLPNSKTRRRTRASINFSKNDQFQQSKVRPGRARARALVINVAARRTVLRFCGSFFSFFFFFFFFCFFFFSVLYFLFVRILRTFPTQQKTMRGEGV